MELAARPARTEDLDELIRLYRLLEVEQTALKSIWPLADGLAEPVEGAFVAAIAADDVVVRVGTIDEVPVGFAVAAVEPLLPQADGEQLGVIRLIFVEQPARGVGAGHTIVTAVLDDLRRLGARRFDARVLPGHRNAKNFFEAHGFSARLILMHHDPARG